MHPEIKRLLQEVRTFLVYHRSLGRDTYPAGSGTAALLKLRQQSSGQRRVVPAESGRPRGRSERPARPGGAATVASAPSPGPVTPIADILEEIQGCTGCSLAENRVVPVAGGGGDRARLLIVGDWMTLAGGRADTAGCVFGIDQDRMLARMLEAIHIDRREVFVTNVIKCGVPDDCQPRAEHVHACTSFLLRQMAALQPVAVLSMGLIATRTLLNRKDPLSRIRGRLQVCADSNGRQIPLVATYHPTYLLKNPEMKKATWQDLQLLAKELKLAVK
ncbi:MAG: uracil-DNA glycosylase [Desulfopila sp.]